MVTTEPLQLTPVQRRTFIVQSCVIESCRLSRRLSIALAIACLTACGSIQCHRIVAVEVPAIRYIKYMVVNNRVVWLIR